ncbi:MAG: hypothetical protein LBH16_00860 [Treponema sp.]|jgi:hypothetical protein|nr:hypothetical protein [Treponema sp.]
MDIKNQHSFWGSLSPLGGLTGAGLLIMASARLSWAVTVALGLFWVYALTVLAYSFLVSTEISRKIFPQKGRENLFACLASFFGSIFLLLFWLLCPFAALEVFLPLLLIPLYCAGSGIFGQITRGGTSPHALPHASLHASLHASPVNDNAHIDIIENVSNAVSRAAVLAGLLIAFSIVREPLSYCSLSFPGTSQGMITIMYFKKGSFFPIGMFASSAGALLLLGYLLTLYQYYRNALFPEVLKNG